MSTLVPVRALLTFTFAWKYGVTIHMYIYEYSSLCDSDMVIPSRFNPSTTSTLSRHLSESLSMLSKHAYHHVCAYVSVSFSKLIMSSRRLSESESLPMLFKASLLMCVYVGFRQLLCRQDDCLSLSPCLFFSRHVSHHVCMCCWHYASPFQCVKTPLF
jgi:hypothetical protein